MIREQENIFYEFSTLDNAKKIEILIKIYFFVKNIKYLNLFYFKTREHKDQITRMNEIMKFEKEELIRKNEVVLKEKEDNIKQRVRKEIL